MFATTAQNVLTYASASVALITIIIALLKRPIETRHLDADSGRLAADASRTAVEVFNASVQNLQHDLHEARKEIAQLEGRLKRVEDHYEKRLEIVTRQRDTAVQEARVSYERTIALEGENYKLIQQLKGK